MEATSGSKNVSANFFQQGEEEDNNLDMIKRRISCHPLYGLLTRTHLDCLKASLGEMEEVVGATELTQTNNNKINTSMSNQSDLDEFMETYCMALTELKDAIAEPVQETSAFVRAMHFELNKLMTTNKSHTSSPDSSVSTDSGEENIRDGRCLNRTPNVPFIHSSGKAKRSQMHETNQI